MKLRYNYYHRNVRSFLSWVIPDNRKVLFVGIDPQFDFEKIKPSFGVFVLPNNAGPISIDGVQCYCNFDISQINEKFDYIILKDVIGMIPDISKFLMKLSGLCSSSTRVIVYCHNPLWYPILKVSELLTLKRSGGLNHLMSSLDIDNVMTVAGFQLISQKKTMLFPLFLCGFGALLNFIGKVIPIFDWLKINQFQIFRLMPEGKLKNSSLTICLTCRDEKENIEPLVNYIPEVTENQEILFVEGHSIDGTKEEIERVIRNNPDKNIRLVEQTGTGQGNAIFEGFQQARGEVIILLEADMTSPPENIEYVYDSINKGFADFIEGSRFVYQMPAGSMPFLNKVGNSLFANLFSWLFSQKITDVLSGIKGINKSGFDDIAIGWDSWGIKDPFGDFELLFGAIRRGLKIAWQPIHYRPRPYGDSKTHFFKHGLVLVRMSVFAFFKFRG